jgi:predicted small metal-binding protein|tara:strand:+ start:500 stop:718 length:219 start_codon:yes stop_codon:yes gene_type:complete
MSIDDDLDHEHSYVFEILYHFTCGKCTKWWSYAKTPDNKEEMYKKIVKHMYCPHCGTKGSLQIKDKFFKENI